MNGDTWKLRVRTIGKVLVSGHKDREKREKPPKILVIIGTLRKGTFIGRNRKTVTCRETVNDSRQVITCGTTTVLPRPIFAILERVL